MNTQIKTWVGTVIIIIIAITTGVFVWLYEKTQPEVAQPVIQNWTNKKVATPKTVNSTASDNQNYIEVKELGFEIPVDAPMADDITYKIIELEGVPYPSVEFDLKTGGCEGGVISRILGIPSKNVTGESEFYTARMSDIKQFDGFFLFYQHPQAVSCDVAKYRDVQQKIIQATYDGFKNISLVDQFSAISDWQTYRNEKYGFELKFTDAWKGYRTETKPLAIGLMPAITQVLIEMPYDKNSWGYFSPLTIIICPLSLWPVWHKDMDRPTQTFINDKYVFYFSTGSDLSDTPPGIKESIQQVMSTFKFTN